MSAAWHFRDFRPGDRARNPQAEKFFRSDVVEDEGNAIVREGIQNSLDAALVDEASGRKAVNVIISFGRLPASRISPYSSGLFEHLNAAKEKFPNVPEPHDDVRYLTFEDFNTSGLTGDPEEWEPPEEENAFYGFFRGEGISNKKGRQRGRHGVGKMVFTVASTARAIYGVTGTETSKSRLLMGTSTLNQHRVNGRPYQMDGWFGLTKDVDGYELVVPISDDRFVTQFVDAFGLERAEFPGLSVVVPWLMESVTPSIVTHAVVRGFYWPVLDGRLRVDVRTESGTETVINRERLESVAAELAGVFPADAADIRAAISLANWAQQQDPNSIPSALVPEGNAQEWDNKLIPEETAVELREKLAGGSPVAVRLPVNVRRKRKGPEQSEMKIYLVPDPECRDGNVQFVRDGLLISGVRYRRCPGFRAIVVIENGALATFLGDAENPSHTEWQKENVRDDYLFHDSCLRYVVNSVSNILKALHDDQDTADPTLLLDLFHLPGEDDDWLKKKPGKKKRKPPAGENPKPGPFPEAPKPRFSVQQTKEGFSIRRGHPEAEIPKSLVVTVAYGVRHGNPFKKYDPVDFDLAKKPIRVRNSGCELDGYGKNVMNVIVQAPDFEIDVAGFDVNRDVFIKVDVDSNSGESTDGPEA